MYAFLLGFPVPASISPPLASMTMPSLFSASITLLPNFIPIPFFPIASGARSECCAPDNIPNGPRIGLTPTCFISPPHKVCSSAPNSALPVFIASALGGV